MAGPWDDFAKPAAGAVRENNPWDDFKGAKAPASTQPVGPWEDFRKPPKNESNTLWGDATAETVWGEIGAGLQTGTRQVISSVPTLAGLGAQTFEDVTGVDTKGLPGALLETGTQIAEGGAKRGIDKVEELELLDPTGWARYAAGTLGEAVPFVISMIGGAGGARMLAQRMAAKGVPASTRATILRTIPPEMLGAGLTATAIETGATAQELYGATKQVEPYASVIAGGAKGALESVFPLMLGKSLGLVGGEANHLLDRLMLSSGSRAGRIGLGMGTEAATEAAQEEIDLVTRNFMDEKFAYMGPEAWSRRLNAPIAGAVGGAGFSAVGEFLREGNPTALNDKMVRDAAGDTPFVTGASADELITSGPEEAIRKMVEGVDVTASAARTMQMDQLLGEVDLRHRGLYAPIIPNQELVFGTQDQAMNDHTLLGGQGYIRLDPTRIKRGEITSAVEDLPDSLNDQRIDFLEPGSLTAASHELTQAIKNKSLAASARSGRATEAYLVAAQQAYRRAIALGARVEPLADSQVMLRDPHKAQTFMEPATGLQSHVTQAGLLSTKTMSNGKSFHVFQKGVEEEGKVKGRRIDLENIAPDEITGLPTREMTHRVLASNQVSRKAALGRARGMGIRFTGATKIADQQRLLREFVRLLQGMSPSADFMKQPKATAEKFMSLVAQGLRLDVRPSTDQFALLNQVTYGKFVPGSEDVGPQIVQDEKTSRIVKSRARRERDPRVGKTVQFWDRETEALFFTQLHDDDLQAVLAGDVGIVGQKYTAKQSPIGDVIRQLVKDVGIKTDYVIEIVPPTVMPDKGVAYEEKDIIPPSGKNPQPRSVIMVNPWYYAVPTTGGKPLVKAVNVFERADGSRIVLGNQGAGAAKWGVTMPDGSKTRLRKVMQLLAPPPEALAFITQGNPTDQMQFVKFTTLEEFQQEFAEDLANGTLKPAEPMLSAAGKIAKKFGVPGSKMFTERRELTEFYADIAEALAESIVVYEWAGTSAAEQELIHTAWRREMHLAKGTNRKSQIARTVPHPIVDRTIGQQRAGKWQQFEFEEWLVHNLARAIIVPKRQTGVVKKFFADVGKKIKSVIDGLFARAQTKGDVLSNDPRLGSPHDTVQRWLDNLEMRGINTANTSFLDQATRDVLIDSINKNRAAFKAEGIDEYVVATPERASSFQVRRLIAMIPPKGHEDAIARLKCLLASTDRHNTMMEWLLGIHQMADMNPHIEGMQVYTSTTRAMENTALSWATLADNRLREAQKLGKAQLDGLAKLMAELDQMSYLSPKEKLDKAYRWPTADELLGLVKKHGLNGDSFRVYVDIRNDFLQFISYLEEVSITNATETLTDPETLLGRIQQIRGETEQIRKRPYFPHMRFGKWAVTVKNVKGKVLHFETFDSKAERDEANRLIAAKYDIPKLGSMTDDYLSDTLQQWQGLPRYALQNVIKQLGLDEEDLTPQQKRDKILLETMAEAALPTESFRRSLVNRRNVPGFSLDAMRAYATYFSRSARFMARLEYSRRLELAIQDVRATASPVSKDKRTQIADFMTRHYQAQMEPANDWAEVRGLGFLWYFAFVPAAAFTNLFQVPMVTVPFLAGKFGDLKTMGRVTAAYAQNTKEFYDWLKGAEVLDTPKNEAIEEAHFNRLIDDGFATELAAISQGPVLQSTIPGSQVSRGLRRIAQWGTAPFALAERINRSVSFRAAYDLAMAENDNVWIDEVMAANKPEVDQLRVDRGWDERVLRSYMAAAETVRRTQFEYGRWSRPKIMTGIKGVLFMFKTYLQNMLFFLFKTDRRTQVRAMLTLFFIAGAMGLPGAEDTMEIAKWLARQFGLQFDFEREVRKMMLEWGADKVVSPDIIMHGASREGFGIPAAMSGLGIPAPTIDLSGSLSMGRLIPGLQKGLNPSASMFNDSVGDMVSEIAGPVLGVPFAMYNAMTDFSMPADDPKRWEKVLPRALKGVSKASRYLAEQRERDRTGATVYKFDPNDISDQMDILLGTGLGFQPTRLSQQWDYITAVKEVQDYWKAQRQVLMSEMYRAHRLKDPEGRKAALEAIRKFNDEAPDKGLRITGDSIRQSLQVRSKGKRLKEEGIPVERSLRGITKDVDALYPEVRREKVPQAHKSSP